MPDTFPPAIRSKIMRAVPRQCTHDEILLYRALRSKGIQVSRRKNGLPGTPDLLLVSRKTAIFVDGDFWHGRPWFEDGFAPVNNRAFWIEKFEGNRKRDRRVDRTLRRLGWNVIRIWSSSIRKSPEAVVSVVLSGLKRRAVLSRNRSARRSSC